MNTITVCVYDLEDLDEKKNKFYIRNIIILYLFLCKLLLLQTFSNELRIINFHPEFSIYNLLFLNNSDMTFNMKNTEDVHQTFIVKLYRISKSIYCSMIKLFDL
jgi:hypothetical protein